jgi:hypothetical protein
MLWRSSLFTCDLGAAGRFHIFNRNGSNVTSYSMRSCLAALRFTLTSRLVLHCKLICDSRSQSNYVESSKVNCLVAQTDHRHAHKHVPDRQLSNVSLPAATHGTVSKDVRIKGSNKTTIEPPPIGRRSKPGLRSRLEDLIASTTKALLHVADNSTASHIRHHAAHTPPAGAQSSSPTKLWSIRANTVAGYVRPQVLGPPRRPAMAHSPAIQVIQEPVRP